MKLKVDNKKQSRLGGMMHQQHILKYLFIITVISIGLIAGCAEQSPRQSVSMRQLTSDWNKNENIESLKLQMGSKCGQFVVIESTATDGTLSLQKIKAEEVTSWVRTPRNDQQLNKIFEANSKRCAIIADTKISPQTFRYFMVRYLLLPIAAGSAKATLDQYKLHIKNSALQVQTKTIGGVQYVIFKLSKPLNVNKDGIWDGGRKEDLANQHYQSQLLSSKLIQFYRKEKISKIIDFGCGFCQYVADLKKAGFNSMGYDGNPFTKQLTEGVADVLNLVEPQDVGKAEWVQSFQVGEHIPLDKTEIFVKNLATHAQKGIILSWGINGQLGYGHINTRDNIQVIEFLKPHGFEVDVKVTLQIRNNPQMRHFRQSLMVFRKKSQ